MPEPLAPLFRYAWLLILAHVGVNALVYRGRLRRLEAEGGITRAESDRLLRGFVLWLGGMGLAMGVLQLAAGWSSPFCMYAGPLTDPFVLGAWAIAAAGLGLLVAWVYLWGGDVLVSRASPALAGRYPGRGWTPRAVRIGVVLAIVACGWGAVMGSANAPTDCFIFEKVLEIG